MANNRRIDDQILFIDRSRLSTTVFHASRSWRSEIVLSGRIAKSHSNAIGIRRDLDVKDENVVGIPGPRQHFVAAMNAEIRELLNGSDGSLLAPNPVRIGKCQRSGRDANLPMHESDAPRGLDLVDNKCHQQRLRLCAPASNAMSVTSRKQRCFQRTGQNMQNLQSEDDCAAALVICRALVIRVGCARAWRSSLALRDSGPSGCNRLVWLVPRIVPRM